MKEGGRERGKSTDLKRVEGREKKGYRDSERGEMGHLGVPDAGAPGAAAGARAPGLPTAKGV